MNEIEERINAIANSLVESIAYKPNEYDLGIAKDALTLIATEQKQIDIDKAWEVAVTMYNMGKEQLVPLTKEEFIKAFNSIP